MPENNEVKGNLVLRKSRKNGKSRINNEADRCMTIRIIHQITEDL